MNDKELESKLRDWFDRNEIDWFSGVGELIRLRLKQLNHWKGKPERGKKVAWIKTKTNKKEFDLFYLRFRSAKKEERDELIEKTIKDIEERI